MTSTSEAPPWVVPVFAGLALFLVPWVVWLSSTLPTAQRAAHYRLAWLGFDVALFVALGGIAFTALRDSRLLEKAATVAAVLLLVDAWFDVTTSTGRGQSLGAIGSAIFAELPLAVLCLWVANHAGAVRRRCAELLRARAPRS